MPFVTRDAAGAIRRLDDTGAAGDWLADDDPELAAFYRDAGMRAKRALTETDVDMVRVIDDLVDVLVAKQLVIFTELPDAVQQKLLARKQLRREIGALQNLMLDDEGLF
ncbi:hypothetical protein [Methylomonas sp. LWB]|uniref:hypothetical protein n=1 Tax=unclassified Methylomonas TaxID=2608980 RepID=UPI0008D8F94C|nr:hypothetical protein [Methylomonas sp. LWB]OHX35237.1 hypothetical protein BJL95_01455 [Methylomonas sp. LWB]